MCVKSGVRRGAVSMRGQRNYHRLGMYEAACYDEVACREIMAFRDKGE